MAEMPVALYRTPVTPGALVVLSRLWAFVSASGPRWAHPTAARLQDELGLPNGTLYRHLRALTDAGVISRARGTSTSGKSVLGWALAEAPPSESSHVRETATLPGLGDETSQPRETDEPPTLPVVGDHDSQDWHSDPPTAGKRISTGSSHVKLPTTRDLVGGAIGWSDPSDDRQQRAAALRTRESEAAKAAALVQRIGDERCRLAGELGSDVPSLTNSDGRTFSAIQDALHECNGNADEVIAVVRHAIESYAAGRLTRQLLRGTFTKGWFGRRRDDWLEARGATRVTGLDAVARARAVLSEGDAPA